MDLRCRGRPGAFAEIEIFAGLCVYVSNRHSYASRFDLAYNVAHALVLAALRQAGYRSDNRYLVFQTLSHTIGMEAARWRVLAKAHERRNLAEYEEHLEQDDRLLAELIVTACEPRDALRLRGTSAG
jgi:hypothetical protein